jgi:hypothetical protein
VLHQLYRAAAARCVGPEAAACDPASALADPVAGLDVHALAGQAPQQPGRSRDLGDIDQTAADREAAALDESALKGLLGQD